MRLLGQLKFENIGDNLLVDIGAFPQEIMNRFFTLWSEI